MSRHDSTFVDMSTSLHSPHTPKGCGLVDMWTGTGSQRSRTNLRALEAVMLVSTPRNLPGIVSSLEVYLRQFSHFGEGNVVHTVPVATTVVHMPILTPIPPTWPHHVRGGKIGSNGNSILHRASDWQSASRLKMNSNPNILNQWLLPKTFIQAGAAKTRLRQPLGTKSSIQFQKPLKGEQNDFIY